MHRLAILSTHPIQYNAPLFRMLNDDESIKLQVFFSKTWDQVKYDPDFQREIVWDIPVSEGYSHSTHDASSRMGKRELTKAIRAFDADALLVYGWNFPGHLASIRKFHRSLPIWFRGDSNLIDPHPAWKKILRQSLLRWVYSHVDLAFSVGVANEAYYKWCGLTPSEITRAPHAIDVDFFRSEHLKRKLLAEEKRIALGIKPHDKTILFAGKLEDKKQPIQLLEAWSRLPEPLPHILIAGSGPLETEMKSKWGGMPRVHFLGFQNQQFMPTLYRMADLFCLPSKGPGETWGLAVNEAMACGTPCLVSDRTGCSLDMFNHLGTGKVVPWNEPTSWTSVIAELLYQPHTPSNWSLVNEEFNLNHFARSIRNALERSKTL